MSFLLRQDRFTNQVVIDRNDPSNGILFKKLGNYLIILSVIQLHAMIQRLSQGLTRGRSSDMISETGVSVEDFPLRITFLE